MIAVVIMWLVILMETFIFVFGVYTLKCVLNITIKKHKEKYKIEGRIISDIDPYGEENWTS